MIMASQWVSLYLVQSVDSLDTLMAVDLILMLGRQGRRGSHFRGKIRREVVVWKIGLRAIQAG
jgi:hypothetical protein